MFTFVLYAPERVALVEYIVRSSKQFSQVRSTHRRTTETVVLTYPSLHATSFDPMDSNSIRAIPTTQIMPAQGGTNSAVMIQVSNAG